MTAVLSPDTGVMAMPAEELVARIAQLELAVGTARDLRTIYRALYEFVASAAPCNGLYVSHYEPMSDHRICVYAISEGEEAEVAQLPPMPMTNSPHSRAVRTGEVSVTDDFQAVVSGQRIVNLGLDRNPQLPQSAIAVPMKVHGRTIGAFEVQSIERAAYRREHAVLLQLAGNLCAIATENVHLLQEEQRLRRLAQASEQRFRALIENSADATVSLGADGVFRYISPGVTRILGYGEAELIGRNAFEIVHPEDQVYLRDRLAQILADPAQMRPSTFRCRHRDGSWRWISGAAKNLLTTERVNGVVGNFQDITDRKEAEAALRASEERYRVLFEHNPCMLLVYDVATRRILAANDAVLQHYDYGRTELLAHSLDDLIAAKTSQLPPDEVIGPRQKALMRHRRKDGSVFDVEVFADPLRFAGRDARIMLCVDTSERVRLEEQLRQMQKMESIGQLAGGVAHDFNNILTVIQARTSLLLQSTAPEDLRESLVEIHDAALRAARLTHQLLAFSRKQSLTLRSLDLNEVVRNMELMLKRVLGEDVTLMVDCAPNLGRIEGDAGMMEQVLMNLAVNARDAMPHGGQLRVGTARWFLTEDQQHRAPGTAVGAEFVCLSIRDTGGGIQPEHMPRIFDPFFTTKDVGKGTGLGLATVYGIVRQHHGWIDVQSDIGAGAEFRVLLPVVSGSTPVVSRSPEDGLSKKLPRGSETVLVVEDEATVREMVVSVLTACGYRVLAAANGHEALSLWRDGNPAIDLVITDLIMPEGITGSELGAQLLADQPNLRLIYTSGYDPRSAVRSPDQANAEFLAKPYDAVTLAKCVRQRLDRA